MAALACRRLWDRNNFTTTCTDAAAAAAADASDAQPMTSSMSQEVEIESQLRNEANDEEKTHAIEDSGRLTVVVLYSDLVSPH
jgi:hypothetical protein